MQHSGNNASSLAVAETGNTILVPRERPSGRAEKTHAAPSEVLRIGLRREPVPHLRRRWEAPTHTASRHGACRRRYARNAVEPPCGGIQRSPTTICLANRKHGIEAAKLRLPNTAVTQGRFGVDPWAVRGRFGVHLGPTSGRHGVMWVDVGSTWGSIQGRFGFVSGSSWAMIRTPFVLAAGSLRDRSGVGRSVVGKCSTL